LNVVPLLEDFPPGFLSIVAIAFGLVFGSFLNVVVYRLPRGLNVAWPGSACPACGKPIAAYDNLPVLSWLLLLGRARCCKVVISPRYPIIEAIGGLYAWALVQTQILTMPMDTSIGVVILYFGCCLGLGLSLVAAAFIDLEHLYLPDVLTFFGVALGLMSLFLRHDISLKDSLIGGAVGFFVVWLPFDRLYRMIRGRVGMGLGDAKLVMLAGVWFGIKGALFALLAGAVQGCIIILSVYLAHGKIDEPEGVQEERKLAQQALETAEGEAREQLLAELAKDPVLAQPHAEGLGQSMVPFGPFLVLAILEYQLFGESVIMPWLLGIGAP
jgi:leader peptidase (prepilin peptidase)/N-methyltransferase